MTIGESRRASERSDAGAAVVAACVRTLLTSTALAPLALAGFALLPPSVALAQDCSFINAADSGAGSLRQCLIDAAPGGTVSSGIVPPGASVTLATPILIDKSVTLGGSNGFSVGSLVDHTLTISGTGHTLTVGRGVEILNSSVHHGAIVAMSGGNVVNLEGSMVTGERVVGIYASGGLNTITVSGSIKSTEYSSRAVNVADGNNTVTLSGSIETTGEGSDGIVAFGGHSTITVTGSVKTEGDGAIGVGVLGGNNALTIYGSLETAGALAHGIEASGGSNTITIAGRVAAAAATAINFRGGVGDNRLELQPGYLILGDAKGDPSGGDTLAFGGAGAGDFDLGRIGTSAPTRTQFYGFEDFVVDSGTWSFSGATTEAFVVNGGIAAGTGTFGSLTIAAGGVQTPGNSIGTQTVNGLYANHGVLEIEVADNGASDQVVVNGTVDVTGGTLRVVALPGAGTLPHPSTYLILDNDGVDAITGAFTLDNTLAFFDASLDHAGGSGNDIELTMLRNGVGLADVAATPNQHSTANALVDFAPLSPTFLEILGLSAAEARAGYESASGEIHASGQHVIDATFALFQSGLGGNGGSNSGVSQVAPLAYAAQPGNAGLGAIDDLDQAPDEHWVWLKPLAGRGVVGADGNAAELDWAAAGLAAGYEGETRLGGGDAGFGVGAGYLNSAGTVAARASTMSGNGGYLGAYGNWTKGALGLSGSLAYGATHIATSRDIVIGAITETAVAAYWSHSIGLDLEAGYGFALGEAMTVSPTGTLRTGWSGHGGATETGAGALNATLDPAGAWLLDTGLGLELAHTSALADGGSLTLKGRALWQHRFGDTTPVQTLALAGSPTGAAVYGPAGDRDRLLVGLGLDYAPTPLTEAGLSYNGSFSGNGAAHALAAGITIGF